jgi:alkylresorcinol/alkylpyrone synthase
MDKVFAHPSINQRRFACSDPGQIVAQSTDQRIERFTHWALELSSRAATQALAKAGLSPQDIDGIVVNTCTGYLCPGISTYLIEKLDLRKNIAAYDLVGSGCGGALPNLQMCRSILAGSPGSVVLSVAVEICSATFQMADDLSLIVSNALFSDGAAAAVVWDRPRGLELKDAATVYAPEFREDIRFVYKNGQLHNQLSLRLPKRVGKTVANLVEELLGRCRVDPARIGHWALHPGGENVLQAIQDHLRLGQEHLSVTRQILAEYGNMSSPTALFVLKRIMDNGMAPGDLCLMAAFGAGLSAHAFLLQAAY